MSKVLFVGDVHLNYQTPSSRKDIYSQTCVDKVSMVAKVANDLNVDETIFLGDVFHQRYQPFAFIMKCYSAFKQFNKTPYTIVGNHDLVYERMDTFEESPLNMLMLTGALKHLDEIDIDGIHIKGFDYPTQIVSDLKSKYNICVAHQYYNTPLFKQFMTPELCLQLGYQSYVLGHDHSVYEPLKNDKFTVIRNGAITRGSSHTSNLVRDVYVTLFDTVTLEYTRIQLPVQPSEDVFKEIKFVEKSLVNSVEDIIDKLEFSAGDTIYDMLDKEEIPDEVRKLIENYLFDHGILRRAKDE